MNKLENIRHSLSHLLAMSVKKKYKDAKLGIGPTIENGFYYDFDIEIKDEDLKELQKTMKHLIKQQIDFTQENISKKEAQKLFKDEPYKLELIKDLEDISIYKSGDFVDLCAGPHTKNTKEIDPNAFLLTKIAGAYWRGDEKNPMLTRVYGVAFNNKEELDEYLKQIEENKKRDHRKLGKELDLFCFSDIVGPGLPMFTPKGTVIIDELQYHIEDVCRGYGFEKVRTPHLAKVELYDISGHSKKFGDELFHVTSEKNHNFAMKPVQCPHQTQIYASRQRSYRDLPIRYMESEKQYRAEKSGEVGGLNRVYAITVEDGHTFCEVSQVKEEIKNMVNIIKDFYSGLGLWERFWVSLSVRDYENPDKYIGTEDDWNKCENILEEVCEEMNLNAKRCEGEAALYGPKIDFMFKSATGQEIQIPTVQIDFATPKRFELVYTDKEGKEVNPVMVHRAVLGSYERFLVMLIEHFSGALPVWLSPTHIKLITVSEKHADYAKKLLKELKENCIRVELDDSNESVGNKTRKAISNKIPYILVIGDKEVESDNFNVRFRGEKETKEFHKDKFLEYIKEKIHNKSLEL